jgi:predicted glycoside hydrolase/deacetylase ChbG (UPF0249 family)
MTDTRGSLILCADDFGLADGVDDGIVQLADAGRLSAISCMAVLPRWPIGARRLERQDTHCDVGLHLTLTDHRPLGGMPNLAASGALPPLARLLAGAMAGALRRHDLAAEVSAELARQWDAFTQVRGRLPDFIDGHQHIHLLPGVRESVIDMISRCPVVARPWLRVCWEPPARILMRRIAVGKAMLLSAMSLPLRRMAAGAGLAANDSFRGVHNFAPGADYRRMFRQFLRGPARRPLIMCHPGLVDDHLRAADHVVEPRQNEFAYFSSPAFAADLSERGYSIARFREFVAL